jgi:hypothetical protein
MVAAFWVDHKGVLQRVILEKGADVTIQNIGVQERPRVEADQGMSSFQEFVLVILLCVYRMHYS